MHYDIVTLQARCHAAQDVFPSWLVRVPGQTCHQSKCGTFRCSREAGERRLLASLQRIWGYCRAMLRTYVGSRCQALCSISWYMACAGAAAGQSAQARVCAALCVCLLRHMLSQTPRHTSCSGCKAAVLTHSTVVDQ